MRARIGITSWAEARDDKPIVEINRSFVQGVVRAGGLPLVLPILEPAAAADVLTAVDAIVLTGGIDVDPAVYGAERHPEVVLVDRQRDDFEIALTRAAHDAGVPVLGLCRGMQLLDVAFGGALVQHLPDITAQSHNQREHVHQVAHDVRVEPGSLLAEVTGGHDTFGVNTLHHQAVDTLGAGLRPVAWADDGVVEAIESDDRLLLGVQWHPELLLDEPVGHCELFDWIVASAGAAARE